MATIRVACDHCGKLVTVAADRLTLDSWAGQYFYTFLCPDGECERFNNKEAGPETVNMLRQVGVTDNGPTNPDDTVTRFANQLADDDRVAAELEQLGQQ